jgi:signal transduction histidine kinase
MFTSVRFRLTVWYLVVFGSLLVLFSSFVYASIMRELQARLDRSLSDSLETAASVLKGEVDENLGNIAAGAPEALAEVRFPNAHILVILDGRVIARQSPDGQDISIPAEALGPITEGAPVMTTVKTLTPDGARLALLNVGLGNQACILVAAHPLADIASQLASIRRTFYLALPCALLIAGLGGFLMAKKSLDPVMEMSEQAERIGATNLHERLHVKHRTDELGRLAGVFNELLSRLDGSFQGMRQFMADASHELRTPLAIIRGEADIALSQDREQGEYRAALEIIQDETARLSRIVEDMLELARADAGQRPLNKSRFYINDVVEECCRSMHILSGAKGVSLDLTPSPDIAITADEDLIRRMLMSLLDNAIKYTPAGGSISVVVRGRSGLQGFCEPQASSEASSGPGSGPSISSESPGYSGTRTSAGLPKASGSLFLGPQALLRAKASGPDTVDIEISDTGIGVPAELASEVFHRFYRGEHARTEHPRGTGLGLAIARWIAESHGGSISVAGNNESGSTFTVSLPAESNSDRVR